MMRINVYILKPTLRQRIRKLRCWFRPHDYSNFTIESWMGGPYKIDHFCRYCEAKKPSDPLYNKVISLIHFDGKEGSPDLKEGDYRHWYRYSNFARYKPNFTKPTVLFPEDKQ